MRAVPRPVGGPLAARTANEVACTPGVSAPLSAAKLSGPPDARSSERVSARRLDVIQDSITDHEREILMFVQALRLASGLQLQRVFWPARPDVASASTARAARRTLRRLADWRVLDPLPDRAMGGRRGGSQSYHWHVGPAGLRLLDRLGAQGKRLVAPTDRHVRHTIGITETVVRLIEADRTGTLECIAWESEPSCWRGYIGAGARRLTLRPDLFVRLGSGAFELRLFVEYDLATESPQTVLDKLERHLLYRQSGAELRDHGVDPKVVWIVPDVRRAAVLQRLIDGLDRRDQALFAVTTQDEATRWLAAETRV